MQASSEQIDDCDQYELSSEDKRLRFTHQRFEITIPVVVYADFESAIDEKNRLKPIMLSCLTVSRTPDINTRLEIIHTPHEEERYFRPFMEYFMQLQERVKKYLFDE